MLDVSLVSLLLSLPHSSDEEYTKQPQRTERSFEKSEVWCMLRLRAPSSTLTGERGYARVHTKELVLVCLPNRVRVQTLRAPPRNTQWISRRNVSLITKRSWAVSNTRFFKRALSTTHHAFGYCLVTSYLAGIATVCSEREAELLLFHNPCSGTRPRGLQFGTLWGGYFFLGSYFFFCLSEIFSIKLPVRRLARTRFHSGSENLCQGSVRDRCGPRFGTGSVRGINFGAASAPKRIYLCTLPQCFVKAFLCIKTHLHAHLTDASEAHLCIKTHPERICASKRI